MEEYVELEQALFLALQLLNQSLAGNDDLQITELAAGLLRDYFGFEALMNVLNDDTAGTLMELGALQALVTDVQLRLLHCKFICSLQSPYHRQAHPLMWHNSMHEVTFCSIGLVPAEFDLGDLCDFDVQLPSISIDINSFRLRPSLQRQHLADLWQQYGVGELSTIQSVCNEFGAGRHAEFVGVDALASPEGSQAFVLEVMIYVCDDCVAGMQRHAVEHSTTFLVFSGVAKSRPKKLFIDKKGSLTETLLCPIQAAPPQAATSTLLLTPDQIFVVKGSATSTVPRLHGCGSYELSTWAVQGFVQQILSGWMDEANAKQEVTDGLVVGEQELYYGCSTRRITIDVWLRATTTDGVRRHLAVEINGLSHFSASSYGVAELHRQTRRDVGVERAVPLMDNTNLICICEPWANSIMCQVGGHMRLAQAMRSMVHPLWEDWLQGRLDTAQPHRVPADHDLFKTGVYPEVRGSMEQSIALGNLQSLPFFGTAEEFERVLQAERCEAVLALETALEERQSLMSLKNALARATSVGVQDAPLIELARGRLDVLEAESSNYGDPYCDACQGKHSKHTCRPGEEARIRYPRGQQVPPLQTPTTPLPQQPLSMRVAVPKGVQGGQAFQVRTPSGVPVMVTAPARVQPGQMFEFVLVPLPMPPPETEQPKQPTQEAPQQPMELLKRQKTGC